MRYIERMRKDTEGEGGEMETDASGRHEDDTDCAPFLPPDDGTEVQTCPLCGVGHGDPCVRCGGRGFHNPGCGQP